MSDSSLSGPVLPRVSVVIPILNEARTLGSTLASLWAQDYPAGLLEILIIDGGSHDRWRDVIAAPANGGPAIRILANPKRSTPAALNIALEETDADAILWLSGHCVLSPNYISAAARVFAEKPRQVVGGRLQVRGDGLQGMLNAMVLSSRFGTGAAPWRFETSAGEARSVTYALYDRRQLLAIGGLDERLVRNQDNEVLSRLRQDGSHMRRVDAVATYLAPAKVSGLLRRAWNNGKWNIWMPRLGKGGLNWWHFAPMLMIGTGVVLTAMSFSTVKALWVLLSLAATYSAMAVISAFGVARMNRAWWAVPILPFLFLLHHAIYGLGSWSALVRPVPVPQTLSETRIES